MDGTRGTRSGRGFWIAFALGWLGVGALVLSSTLTLEQTPLDQALVLTGVFFGPLVTLSALVAANRRRILRPERTMAHTLAVAFAVGIAFAVAAGLLVQTGMRSFAQPVGEFGGGPWIHIANAFFIYITFMGLILWSESVRRVHESRSHIAHEAMLRAQAEAKAIRSQFNPHFVFNTLHSLMLLVRADPTTAERAIEDVGELIRYASTLQRRDVDRVPLAKELAVVRRYLALERLRLADRLHVVWDIGEGLDRVGVPAFSVQTLVENAIKHGLEPSVGGGTVTITVSAEKDVLTIEVLDDGAGDPRSDTELESGHGLDLLTQRLRVLYGDEASLIAEGRADGGFRAKVEVPCER